MKKFACFIISLVLALSCFAVPAYAKSQITLNISQSNIAQEVPSTLYGISLEDTSYACDGGLVSNLVNNGSFEYSLKPEAFWEFDNVDTVLSTSDPINQNNPSYEAVTVDGKGTIKNLGFTEIYDYKTYDYNEKSASTADMGFQENVSYDFSCYVKNVDFNGTISVYLDSKKNKSNVTKITTNSVSKNQWEKISATLSSSATEDGGLAIVFEGTGTIQIDFVSLVPQNSYGYGLEQWKYTSLRSDLFTALKNLSPKYIRFPGGCLSESTGDGALYSWKDTIGSLEERLQSSNIWSVDGTNCYNNTNAMGYHEYLQLCEDLQAVAVPVLNVGIACQSKGDSSASLAPNTTEFDNFLQDIYDFIEYCNGDSVTTYWGSLRAQNGHTEPFNLQYIALGNENNGDEYFTNFDAIYNAVKEKYPDITIVSSVGSDYSNDSFTSAKTTIDSKYADTIADEHYYAGDNYLFSQSTKYDSYSRNGASVMVGEYNAICQGFGTMITKNNIYSAVEEATFMTGFERNCDIVKMTSYAPTLAKINANSNNTNLVWFDSQSLVLTPNYYVQMLFSNNVGTNYVSSQLTSSNDITDISQCVTVDEANQVVYIKLVNSGSKRKVSVNLDGFGDINYVSNQSISNKYKSASNELNKQRVAPTDTQLDSSSNSVEITLDKNSVNVVRIAYGDNNGEKLYQLPTDFSLDTVSYTPAKVKAVKIVVVVAVVACVGSVAVVKISKSKNKKSKGKDR